MKKNVFFLMLTFASTSMAVSPTIAQYAKNSGIIHAKSVESFTRVLRAEAADKVALDFLKSKSNKAFTHFISEFKGANNIKVDASNKTIYISCATGDVHNRIRYSLKGRWLNTIKTYDNSKLPDDVRDLITDNYSRFRIFGVALEVHVGPKMAHLVLIETDKEWKRIKVVDGEYEEYESYKKVSSNK